MSMFSGDRPDGLPFYGSYKLNYLVVFGIYVAGERTLEWSHFGFDAWAT